MRKLILLSLLLLPAVIYGQTKENKVKLEKYEKDGIYKVDGDNIVVSAVLDNIKGSKEDIYIKVQNYFARAYNDGNSVIQTDDKEAGVIIGKGLFSPVFTYTANLIVPVQYGAYHILRVDIKEGRVRIICSANQWVAEWNKGGDNYKKEERMITSCFPYTKQGIYASKGKVADALVALIEQMHISVSSMEKALTDGIVVGENEDW